MPDLPAPDAVFIGGGLDAALLDALWASLPAGTRIVPTPPATPKAEPPPRKVHAPPVSAEPQPELTNRSKVSAATTAGGPGCETVTCRVVSSVAPSSSVTRNVTV